MKRKTNNQKNKEILDKYNIPDHVDGLDQNGLDALVKMLGNKIYPGLGDKMTDTSFDITKKSKEKIEKG